MAISPLLLSHIPRSTPFFCSLTNTLSNVCLASSLGSTRGINFRLAAAGEWKKEAGVQKGQKVTSRIQNGDCEKAW